VVIVTTRRFSHCTAGWMGLGADLDVHRKSRPHRGSIPDRKGRSESPYRLSYDSRTKIGQIHKNLDSDRLSHFERLADINVRLLFFTSATTIRCETILAYFYTQAIMCPKKNVDRW
jgi:hypothetical protein